MENHIQLHSTHLVLNVLPFELFPELLNNEINRKCLEEGAYSYFKTRYDTLKKIWRLIQNNSKVLPEKACGIDVNFCVFQARLG